MPPLNYKRYGVVAELRNGTRVFLRDIRGNDYSTLLAIAGNDAYRLSEIKDPSIVVDVGAHIGIFSLIVAGRYPKARVFAIEPDTENYELLERNIALNGLQNITPINAAIGKDFGQTAFYSSGSSVGHSTVNTHVGAETKQVETIPLSKFSDIDALKFDAEGAEYLIDEFPPVSYIALEVHDIPGKPMEAVLQEVRSKFRILKEEKEKTGHVTFIGMRRL
jgi:FkbM family methyltransferase